MKESPEPAGLTAAHLEVWASVATLLERLPAALDAQLQRDSGLTHFEHGLLYALDTAPDGALQMSTLAGYASSTLSRVSRAVSRLEKRGLVGRRTDPRDGRVTLARITEAGRALVAQSTPAHHALVERLVFDPLTEQQIRHLATISRRIASAVDPAPMWNPRAAAADGERSSPVAEAGSA